MANPNLELLQGMAHAMGLLCDQVVFVGGCATGLLITQPHVADARATEDVDAIVEVASLVAYHALADQLMARGFKQTMAAITPTGRVPVLAGSGATWFLEGDHSGAAAALPGAAVITTNTRP